MILLARPLTIELVRTDLLSEILSDSVFDGTYALVERATEACGVSFDS